MGISNITNKPQDYGSFSHGQSIGPSRNHFTSLQGSFPSSTDTKIHAVHDQTFHNAGPIPQALFSSREIAHISEGVSSLIAKIMEAVATFFNFIASFLPVSPEKQLVKEMLVSNDRDQFKKDFDRCIYTIVKQNPNDKPSMAKASLEELLHILGENGVNLLVQTLSTDLAVNLKKRMKHYENPINFAKSAYTIEDLGSSIQITAEFPMAKKGFDDKLGITYSDFVLISRRITISKKDLGEVLDSVKQAKINELTRKASQERQENSVVSKETQKQLKEELKGYAPSLSVSDRFNKISARAATEQKGSTFKNDSEAKYEKYAISGKTIVENDPPERVGQSFDV